MPTLSDALAVALQQIQAGQLPAAEQTCRQILAADPNNSDAHHLLGVMATQLGQYEIAADLITRAIALKGSEPVFHSNLGAVLKDQGKLDEAVSSCRRAVELKPDYAAGHYNLGNALVAQGKFDEAIESYHHALQVKPDLVEALSNLGTAFLAQGKLEEAVACCRRTIELKPSDIAAHFNLGNARMALGQFDAAVASLRRALQLNPKLPRAHVNLADALQAQGNIDEAIGFYRRALELNPADAAAHNNFGTAFQAQGNLEEAIACFRKTLQLQPDNAEAHSNLGNALSAQRQLDEAIASYRRALDLSPDFAVVHYNLGTAFQAQGQLDDAVACYRRVLALVPNHAPAHNNLGTVVNDQGKFDEALLYFRRALELKPDFSEAWSNLLLALQYHANASLSELSAALAEYDRLQAAPLRTAWRPHENDRDPERPLRLGFVSPDFGLTPVGFFLTPALENLDRGQCQTVCYSDRTFNDDWAKRFQAAATTWRDIARFTDHELAEQIRADRIDILFDLAGHTAKNRLLVFARKPAPIQITWAGYVGTTGLEAMDYILADRYEIPPQAETHYRERVLRMPDGYVCYDPPPYAAPVSPLPALERGFVTLGSFNNRVKITSKMLALWADILRRLPQSRLVLKYRGLNYPSVANVLLKEFITHGIDPQRVECLGWSHHEALLAEYSRIDLALDTFPYGGGLTTCEALWMGVPVITCPGETFASRHSLSHLSNIGLTETIARDLDHYVDLAVSLATDLPRLSALRAGLRPRMAASPLCDRARFAKNLMDHLRDIWQQRCHQPAGYPRGGN